MADFCQECSVRLLGEDSKDLSGLGPAVRVLCEGCGDYVLVNRDGVRIDSRHPDDLAVDRFCQAMKEKLALARQKGRSGWNDVDHCSAEDLSQMLVEHVGKGDPVDVANFAMMLHQRGERIETAVVLRVDKGKGLSDHEQLTKIRALEAELAATREVGFCEEQKLKAEIARLRGRLMAVEDLRTEGELCMACSEFVEEALARPEGDEG